jgi:hypothetical protein
MNAHLDDRTIAELILGTGNGEIPQHLDTRAVCRDEANDLRNAIACCRESIHAEAERDEIFWTKQRLAIRQHIVAPVSVGLFPRIAIAALAMVLVVFAASLLVRRPQSTQLAIKEVPRQMTNDGADDALLQQVQADVERAFPIALEPAGLISQERSSAVSAASAAEPRHSNGKEQEQ